MTRPVTVLIPSLADFELLERSLPPLLAEVDRRGVDDQVLVIDDTGEDALRSWLDAHFPRVRVHVRDDNGGFAAALLGGAQAADYQLLFLMNPDVVVRPGFLDPLVTTLLDETIYAASPRVLLAGDDERVESAGRLEVEDGRLIVRESRTRRPDESHELRAIPFAIGGAMLVRRAEFLADEGFDPLFAPFYWEDVDMGITAWRRGRTIVEVPASVVEHHHRGTIGTHVPEPIVRAAIEKNRLLVHWKHLSDRRDAHDHLTALWRDAFDAGLAGRREELIWIALALEEMQKVSDARGRIGTAVASLGEVLERHAIV